MSAARPVSPRGTGAATELPVTAAQVDTGENEGYHPAQLTDLVGQVRRLALLGTSGTVSRARSFTRQALLDWGWLPAPTRELEESAEDVLLVVSELVTNACLHAAAPEELRLGRGPGALRIEVSDPRTGSPAPQEARAPGRPGGHGIFIVQRLCRDWGVVRHPDGQGKTVWADIAAPDCG